MSAICDVYKCSACGNVIEVIYGVQSEIICCGKKMVLMEANTNRAAPEKHIPIIEKEKNSLKIKVGETEHPMEDNHYIVMIEVIDGSYIHKKQLKFNDSPTAEFNIASDNIIARAYCNLHGLWENKIN